MPKISVIMPVFNQEASYLRLAIESILNQSYSDFEFIIIDDGSRDEIAAILTEYSHRDERIRLLRNEKNSGIIVSLNRGIDATRGEYIARMDSDDISLANRFEKQLKFLEQYPEYDLVGANAITIDEDGKESGKLIFPQTYHSIFYSILLRNPILHPTWFLRRSLFEAVGHYDINAQRIEDYEFLLRIAPRRKIANLPEQLLYYRFNHSGISFNNNKLQEKQAILIRIKALRDYGYPIWHAIHLLRPLFLYFLIPSTLKKKLIQLSFKLS